MAKKTSEKMTEERRARLQSFTRLRHTGRISRATQTIIETSLGFRASVGNQNMRKYKVGDRLLVKLSGGRIVEATAKAAKAVVDVVSGHAS